jgi:hypothetical protein
MVRINAETGTLYFLYNTTKYTFIVGNLLLFFFNKGV